MAVKSVADLVMLARDAREPRLTEILGIAAGGVDPLGLRQINFQLMDLVLPGLNNVARNIRPFSVIAWAWRRAVWCANKAGRQEVQLSELQDFVDRIEVIFAWSQFLRDPEADLPGRDFLAALCRSEKFEFGGKLWEQMRDKRRYSTALSAPVNYGPAVKTLGWIEASQMYRGAFVSSDRVSSALDAFEQELGDHISHPAFCSLGTVEVTRDQAVAWGAAWNMDKPSLKEKSAMLACLTDIERSQAFQRASACIAESVSFHQGTVDVSEIRANLCGQPSIFVPTEGLREVMLFWRMVQMRQLFRLALEALLHWTTVMVNERPQHTHRLTEIFLLGAGNEVTARSWLNSKGLMAESIPARIGLLQDALSREATFEDLPLNIREALSVSLSETFEDVVIQSLDRLPLSRAKREADSFGGDLPEVFMTHVFTSWIFGQHVYWSVGRGLGDARGRGKTILRLKIVPEEAGWTLAPGTNIRNAPRATPDRLDTAVSLMEQAGLFTG
jgi:hypothetical protein